MCVWLMLGNTNEGAAVTAVWFESQCSKKWPAHQGPPTKPIVLELTNQAIKMAAMHFSSGLAFQQQQQQALQARAQSIRNELQTFAGEMENGKPAHPYVEKVGHAMAGLIRGGLVEKFDESMQHLAAVIPGFDPVPSTRKFNRNPRQDVKQSVLDGIEKRGDRQQSHDSEPIDLSAAGAPNFDASTTRPLDHSIAHARCLVR